MAPRYREVKAGSIPVVKTKEGATIRVVAGEAGNAQGSVRDVITAPTYLDVSVPKKSVFSYPVDPGHTALAYVFDGEGKFDDARPALPNRTLALFGPGGLVQATTGKSHFRFLLIAGKPLKEPVAWAGPIVMNTQEELKQAFEDLDRDRFVHRG